MTTRISPDAARALVARCGGPQKVADALGLHRRTVLYYHTRGMSRKIAMSLKGAFPTAYADWAKQQ